MLDALCYRERGWSCFPVNQTKKPVVKYRHLFDRLPTEDELKDWFSRPSVRGVAVLNAFGLTTRDWDKKDAYHAWREREPALALSLPTVETDRGFHTWQESDLHRIVKLADGEFRGGGITLAPH